MAVDRHPTGSSSRRAGRGSGATFRGLLERRLSRRRLLRTSAVASAAVALGSGPARSVRAAEPAAPAGQASTLTFVSIQPDTSDQITVAEGYQSQVLVSWGDPLFAGVPPFDINSQTAALQEQRFGFNNDFVAYMPLPPGSGNPGEGLLWVNHESTDGLMMFPGYQAGNPTEEQVNIELAAHGGSVLHVRRGPDGSYAYDPSSPYNRRITATTPMSLSGPATGAELMKTDADPTGIFVLGMLNNCAGGWTPWGTILTAEENFNQYFYNAEKLPDEDPRKAQHARYDMPPASRTRDRRWDLYYERFDVARHPNEPHRHGWIVEVDPYNPSSTPIKRTALGRFKHEGAATVVATNGKVVAYSGDDQRFEYVYKFVTDGAYDPNDRAANLGLLDAGTLYAARFDEDGTGVWLPLVYGQGPLTEANGFTSQADVLIRTREAADAVGATKMDRPEDIEVNPVNGRVYMAMTGNNQRGMDGRPGPDAANPRPDNVFGHVIEATEDGNDYTATTFRWEAFILAGSPADPSTYFAGFPKDQVSPIANPDNVTFDSRGNVWIATDGQPVSLNVNDALFAVPAEGPERGHLKQFLSAVVGGEVTGPAFTPDDTTRFVAIQHPGLGGNLAQPTSTWPNGLARPSVIVVTRVGGGPIGG